jgi:hypothetical protein
MSDIYLSLTETPSVVTLSQPVISSSVAATVTVGNTVTVALDANSLSALENVTVTVGAAVSVSNFPSTQVVTGSVAVTTMPAISISSVSISNFPSTQTIAGTVTANGGDGTFLAGGLRGGAKTALSLDIGTGYLQTKVESMPALSGTITIGNAVTIGGISNVDVIPSAITSGNLGPINNSMSAVTVNTSAFDSGTSGDHVYFNFRYWQTGTIPAGANILQSSSNNSSWANVTTGFNLDSQEVETLVLDNLALYTEKRYLFPRTTDRRYWRVQTGPQPSGGQDSYARFSVFSLRPDYQFISTGTYLNGGATTVGYYALSTAIANPVTVGNSVTIGSLPAISGTVTANNPSGALTTRFGSVTTANTAQLTSAVTNTSRKYLLVQNIATSTVTIGIGFAPTTTQGIQLTAGAGLTFDAFCPTGGVWWLSSTTGSNFSILEG